MKTKKYSMAMLFLLLVSVSYSQTTKEKEMIIKERIRRIEFFHASFGIDVSANKNFYTSPWLSLGVGSFRNLLNADLGVKYTIGNPFFFDDKEHLVPQQLQLFAALQLNVLSWKTNCVFVGGSMAYGVPFAAFHHLPSSNIIEYDKEVGCRHFSTEICTGIRFDNWRMSLFYEYDLAPALNQKYVFESLNYDYDLMKDILFERGRFGFSVAYYIPFKL